MEPTEDLAIEDLAIEDYGVLADGSDMTAPEAQSLVTSFADHDRYNDLIKLLRYQVAARNAA